MTPAPQALLAALDVQAWTGQQIGPEQLSLSTPCPLWPVREVLNHSIGVTLKFASFAAGHTDHPRAPAGDLVGDDHALALRSAAEAARVAWASTDLTRLCYLPFGTFPAALAAGINLFDVLAHTWDMAAAAGIALHCSDELWATGLDAACTVLSPGRDLQHYAAAVPAGAAAPPRQRFLAFLGRSEPWPVT